MIPVGADLSALGILHDTPMSYFNLKMYQLIGNVVDIAQASTSALRVAPVTAARPLA